MSSPLKNRLLEEIKTAMKAGDKQRLSALRMMSAAAKQKEIDERIELDDSHLLAIFDKMLKERRDSIEKFQEAKRQDLVDIEAYEVGIIKEFLPTPLSSDEIDELIASAVTDTGATNIKDMGKVMAALKPQLQGKADIGEVSAKIKAKLAV